MVSKAFSNSYPQNKLECIGTNKYSCRVCSNIKKSSEKETGSYSFDSYRDIFTAENYQELLIKIIHTRYTYDDENNLINDFLERGQNEKYTEYRNFVTWAKQVAKDEKGES